MSEESHSVPAKNGYSNGDCNDNISHEATRNDMAQFWREHSTKASLEEMMLDDNAKELSKVELPEILSLLPGIEGKTILELGAGIGRYTAPLAQKAKHVTAVDFMESFIRKNEEVNGHHQNVRFMQADVTKLDMPPKSFDLVFSNWLMMYLSDEEVQGLAEKVLTWLKDDGIFFFRESCFHQSGNHRRSFNPTNYRRPSDYDSLIQSAGIPISGENGGAMHFGFEIELAKSVETYIKAKKNVNQFCWVIKKRRLQGMAHNGYKTFQQFLDAQQYTRNGILRYEKIFGYGYVSTGGPETTEEFVARLDLLPDQHVLDVGCGIGGGDFYMAKKFGAVVTAMDLSTNMIEIATERASKENITKVRFEISDCTKREYPAESFDVVYSRDTILHVKDKLPLFKNFLTWLKPGGKLLISDYCCGDKEWSEVFKKYVAQRGYTLYTPAKYGKLLEEAGFINVQAEDRTQQFMDILNREVARTEANKEEFIKEFSEEDFRYIVDGWKEKLHRSELGDQKWGLFYAEKAK
ncbi:uncharacterized protein LOC144920768 isoform X1 [Branchiostoma floridae x Branchiostoma belcheri]